MDLGDEGFGLPARPGRCAPLGERRARRQGVAQQLPFAFR